jgi:hypothetical protein
MFNPSITIPGIGYNRRQDLFSYGLLVFLGMAVWINPDSFLWRDDWTFLLYFYQGDFSFLKRDIGSDVKPLYQYVLFAEFCTAGTRFILYQAVNAILLTFSSLVAYRILINLQINRLVCLGVSLFYLLHPTHFVNVFWISQQAELIHILFVLLSILFFLLFLEDGKSRSLFFFCFFLVTQNYFFPNGVFLPVMFLLCYFILKHRHDRNWLLPSFCIVIFALQLTSVLYIQRELMDAHGNPSSVFNDLDKKAVYFFEFISIAVWRMAIPNFQPTASHMINLAGLVMLMGTLLAGYKISLYRTAKKGMLLALLGLIFSSVVLAMTRYQQVQIHYYYTCLLLFYLCMLLALFLDYFSKSLKFMMLPGIGILTFVFIFFDFRGREIFASRNILNRQKIEVAIKSHAAYFPSDDPNIGMKGYLLLENHPAPETAVILYRYLKDKD